MVDTLAIRRDLLGSRPSVTRTGVTSAVGLFVLALVVAATSDVYITRTRLLFLLVGCGLVLAVAVAYVNSGLLVSWALVFAPAGGALTVDWWQTLGEPSPVALPGSFGGQGAVAFWVLFTFLFGTGCWVVGVFAGWVRRSVVAR
jgi:hypothetical protein